MRQIEIMGSCPNAIIYKAKKIINSINKSPVKSKKLSGMKSLHSIRINRKYRILLSNDDRIYVGNHNCYEKKIKSLKKRSS